MAILHFQASNKITRPDGSVQFIDPQKALIFNGPLIQVSVSISSAFSSQLLAQGKTVPPPLIGSALIDTGAGITCIDETLAVSAGLPVIDLMDVSSASHASTQKPVFPIQVELAGSSIKVDIGRAAGAELSCQGLLLLIGRDFLTDCTLIYNGATGITTLAK